MQLVNQPLFFGAALCLIFITGCRETILHDLDEQAANRVKMVLARVAIAADKSRDGAVWNISVPNDQATQALAVLDASRVIRPDISHQTQNSSSFIQSREERMQIYERQLAWNLETTLERLPGVLESRVHLYLEQQDTMEIKPVKRKQSASVLLIVEHEDLVDHEKVRKLISGASGVLPEDVIVLLSKPAGQTQVATAFAPVELDAKTSGNNGVRIRANTTWVLAMTGGAVFVGCTAVMLLRRRNHKRSRRSASENIVPLTSFTARRNNSEKLSAAETGEENSARAARLYSCHSEEF